MFLCISLVRRRLQQIQLVKGPNRILLTLEDLTFINPQLSKKVSTIPETLSPISSDGKTQSCTFTDSIMVFLWSWPTENHVRGSERVQEWSGGEIC